MDFIKRLFAIVIKEVRQLRRDRLTASMIIGIPTIQLLLFGFAINMDVRHLRAAVVDQAGTAASRAVAAQLEQVQVVDVLYRMPTPAPLDGLFRSGAISVAIVIPPDYEQRLAQHDQAALQLIVDGSDPVIQQAARQLAALPLGDTPARVGVESLNLYNPERRSAINTVPGLIGVILTMTMVMFTAVAIVRERERGNLELLITTPVRPLELILGKVVPFIGIGLVQVTVVLSLGVLIFHVPVRGALIEVYAAALAYIIASLSLGVLISTFANTQFQAMQLAFFTFLPQILLSGFMFPFAGMPVPAQHFAEILPLTHFIRLIRGIVLRGATLGDLVGELRALGIFAVVLLSLATLRFRKRLD
jgi:ABC-2 type transport system permease protein